jgi:multidrug efflux system membrane fusion protein
VTVAAAVQRDAPVTLRAIGNVAAYSTVSLKAQVEGRVARVYFAEGQEVKRGDLLFALDARPFEAALRQAEGNLARDRAQAENARVEADRFARLMKEGVVSQDEDDQAHARAASLDATVTADQAAVESARIQLQYCSIASPIDGRIGQILVHEGNVVKANETEMAVINQLRPIYVEFSVPQQELDTIRARMAGGELPVEALRPAAEDPVAGTLSFINNTVDTASGTVLLKAVFPNANEELWPGQFVTVALRLATRHDAVMVPSRAVQTGQDGKFVFVVQPDGTVASRPVSVGQSVGQDVVIEQGVTAGEQVVTEGQLRLAPGVRVQVKEESA